MHLFQLLSDFLNIIFSYSIYNECQRSYYYFNLTEPEAQKLVMVDNVEVEPTQVF